jgi:hypothetical protein
MLSTLTKKLNISEIEFKLFRALIISKMVNLKMNKIGLEETINTLKSQKQA